MVKYLSIPTVFLLILQFLDMKGKKNTILVKSSLTLVYSVI